MMKMAVSVLVTEGHFGTRNIAEYNRAYAAKADALGYGWWVQMAGDWANINRRQSSRRAPHNAVQAHAIAILKSVDKNQMLVLALANVPTIITVLIGILLNNGRLNDLNSRFSGLETRFTGMENKFDNRIEGLEHKFDTRFDLLLSKVVDLDNRLTRIEAQRH